jgi:pSer/pThr/pTyr-binding forkhead associated (FHA) protein
VILLDDKSVSRNHAVLSITGSPPPTQSQTQVQTSPTSIRLTDNGSKFGTKVNNIQVPSNETVTVENGDIVLFGMQETFRCVCWCEHYGNCGQFSV